MDSNVRDNHIENDQNNRSPWLYSLGNGYVHAFLAISCEWYYDHIYSEFVMISDRGISIENRSADISVDFPKYISLNILLHLLTRQIDQIIFLSLVLWPLLYINFFYDGRNEHHTILCTLNQNHPIYIFCDAQSKSVSLFIIIWLTK